MKNHSWKKTFAASAISLAYMACFLAGGHYATFAKIVFVAFLVIIGLLIGFIKPEDAPKRNVYQKAVNWIFTGFEVAVLVHVGSPIIAAAALLVSVYASIIINGKVRDAGIAET